MLYVQTIISTIRLDELKLDSFNRWCHFTICGRSTWNPDETQLQYVAVMYIRVLASFINSLFHHWRKSEDMKLWLDWIYAWQLAKTGHILTFFLMHTLLDDHRWYLILSPTYPEQNMKCLPFSKGSKVDNFQLIEMKHWRGTTPDLGLCLYKISKL